MDFRGMPIVDRALTIGIVVMLVASVVVLAWAVATPRVGERFTQLAILGPGGMATDYPRNLSVAEDARVKISVKSFEHEPMDYTLVIVLTDILDYNFTVAQYSIDWNATQPLTPHVGIAANFTLNHLDYFNQTLNFSAGGSGTWKMQFLLYEQGQPLTQDSYREVHLWLNVT